ncbi:MAG: TIGR03364 family FAD-dependent oxidoreductase [Planctomycetota bacterium]
MKSTDRVDLLIVGGGVLGTFFAYHAIARGMRVMLVERNSAPIGATVRNFGMVVPSGLSESWQVFGRESLEIYQSIQSQFDISVRQLGSIYLASDGDEMTLLQELHAINSQNGYPSELWTAAKCRQRYPQLRADYCVGGLFFPEEISVNPRVMIHQLHDYLSSHDRYESRFQTTICDLAVDDQGHVKATTNTGNELQAMKAIVCSGSEFQTLFPKRFLSSDLQAVKLQMLQLKPQSRADLPGNILTGLSIRRYESFSQCPSWESIKSREPEDSFEKRWGIHILFKREADGRIILGDSHQVASVAKYDTLGFDLRDDVNQFMMKSAAQIIDLPCWELESSWTGIYCQTEDPSGVFTETIDDQIHVVTGIGGKGMTSSAGFTKHFLKAVYDD